MLRHSLREAPALALTAGGYLLACDVSVEYTVIARRHWEGAGEAGRYDFALIDADKEGYLDYYEQLMQLVRPGSLIAVGNSIRPHRG